MALLVAATALGATACDKEAPLDPCDRAAQNVSRLHAAEGPVAEARTDVNEPVHFRERCQAARLSASELDCIGYASSWREAELCSPRVFRDLTVSR